MKIVSSEQIRIMDRHAIGDCGMSGEVLMDRAGRAVADNVLELSRLAGFVRPSILGIAGKGNNAGDVFAAARILAGLGVHIEVWLAGDAGKIDGDARTHMTGMLAAGVTVRQMPAEQDWHNPGIFERHWEIVIDGLLGTGLRGAVQDTMAGAIALVNRLSRRSLIVAVDVPSGLDADTGVPRNDAVFADLTVTMAFPKQGLLTQAGIEHTGSLVVADIGFPSDIANNITSSLELIEEGEIRSLFKRRSRHAHKGVFGHILVIGGSAGFGGAAAMAARAALRTGAGLVSVFTPRSVAGVVAASVQEAMVHGTKETSEGTLSADFWPLNGRDLSMFDAVLVGPGMGIHDECRKVVMEILSRCKVPLVLDADALNVQKKFDKFISAATCSVTITPHPGELARFMAESTDSIQTNRVKAAFDAVDETNATVVLKGAGTIVAARAKTPFINMTGNPGMATGGSGDVLSGVLVSLLGQGFSPFDASKAAVYIHGRAGDRAAWRSSQAGIVAGDLIEEIPFVLKDLCGR
ncbi:MAG: NAD(P)H-hydrate dehydratase [bacterium]